MNNWLGLSQQKSAECCEKFFWRMDRNKKFNCTLDAHHIKQIIAVLLYLIALRMIWSLL